MNLFNLFQKLCCLIVACGGFLLNVISQTVLNYPICRSHADYIEVYRIQIDNEKTVLEATMYNLPDYWVQLNSSDILRGCQTGKSYKFLKAEGFEIDRKVFMPDSCCRSFKVYFEPIDKADKAVHWLENGRNTIFSTLPVCEMLPTKGTYACRIKGEVKGETSCCRLLLLDPLGDIRIDQFISIPVYGNKFDYTYYTDKIEVKKLVKWEEFVNGSFEEHTLFIEKGNNNLCLSDSAGLKVKSGTSLNLECQSLQEEIHNEENRRGISELKVQLDSLTEVESSFCTPQAIALFEELKCLTKESSFTDSIDIKRNKIYKQIENLRDSAMLYTKEYYAIENQYNAIVDGVNQKIMEKLS